VRARSEYIHAFGSQRKTEDRSHERVPGGIFPVHATRIAGRVYKTLLQRQDRETSAAYTPLIPGKKGEKNEQKRATSPGVL
jgi:hypothetical protein